MVTLEQMKGFLSSSLSSVNKNKLRGMLAEIKLREHLDEMGFGDNISAGGWIARSVIGPEQSKFAENTVALFPETIMPGRHYGMEREFPDPSYGLHTICATMHQIGRGCVEGEGSTTSVRTYDEFGFPLWPHRMTPQPGTTNPGF